MNYKLEKFWNFSIELVITLVNIMNYKLEKFWNSSSKSSSNLFMYMNYKLEKFWNKYSRGVTIKEIGVWTINLKSFEMFLELLE